MFGGYGDGVSARAGDGSDEEEGVLPGAAERGSGTGQSAGVGQGDCAVGFEPEGKPWGALPQ